MEIWDLYDQNGQKTNLTIVRGEVIPSGLYHMVVIILVKSGDRWLIQKRSQMKDLLPGIWAFTGGSALSGETSEEAARRELFEETGIDAESMIHVKRIIKGDYFSDLWLVEQSIVTEALVCEEGEVDAIEMVTYPMILRMKREKNFHNYSDEFMDVFRLLNT